MCVDGLVTYLLSSDVHTMTSEAITIELKMINYPLTSGALSAM